jgi:hypothetical protein
MPAEIINGWRITSDSETFRIFPKAADGTTRPITRCNQFLRLQRDGALIVIKRYLHQRQWFWKVSTLGDKHCYDLDVRDELSRLLFPVPGKQDGEGRRLGDREKATEVMVGFLTGRFAI